MTAGDFRLYDVLNCAAIAVDEGQAGDRCRAGNAWHQARNAASALANARDCPELRQALGMVLATASTFTSLRSEHAADVRDVLIAAADAVLPAIAGDRVPAVEALAGAALAAERVPSLRGPLAVLRGETCRMAQAAAGTETAQ